MEETFTPRIQVPPSQPVDSGPADMAERRTVRIAAPAAGPVPTSPSLAAAYEIQEKIGDGGMGVVYLARDRRLGRHVAVKRLNKANLADVSLRRRFFREAEAIAALHHANIVHVYALAEDHDGPYIVMEYVAGPPEASPGKKPARPFTLADKVHRDGPLPATGALGLMIKVCRAMEYAHGCGVIHRDLKPSNILLDEQGEPKIVDFGLAHKAVENEQPLTVPGERMLSLGYGAPEQERDASTTDERTDVYGLGGLLYFSLTGKNPRFFREKDVPEALRAVILKALETDPLARWPRVSDLTEALVLVHAPSSIELPTVKTTWRCKWCDAVNPVTIQYCGKCGWNGGELCRECGTESRVGIQFCGVCGADAREYERADILLKLLCEHRDRKEFEFIERHAGQVSGFLPVGPNGQRVVDRIQQLREEASRAIVRRKTLRSAIDREFKAEDYDAVRRHVQEFQSISNETLYDDMFRSLPGLITTRDLRRAREALRHDRIEEARRITLRLLGSVAPGNAQAQALLRAISRKRRRVRSRNAGVIIVLTFLTYVFSAAPMYRIIGHSRPVLYWRLFGAVHRMHDATLFRVPLELHARWCGVAGMFAETEGDR
jgi:serine/threonine protein kinase